MMKYKQFVEQNLCELYEEIEPTERDSRESNSRGKLHEILVHRYLHHLYGLKHEQTATEKAEEEHHRKILGKKESEISDAAAESAARDLKQHWDSEHPAHAVTSIHHTAQPGDVARVTGVADANQQNEKGDIVAEFKQKPKTQTNKPKTMFSAVSLKRYKETVGNTKDLSNPGLHSSMAEIEAEYRSKIKETLAQNGLDPKKKKERKIWTAFNPEAKKKFNEMHVEKHGKMAQALADHFNSAHPGHKTNFMAKHFGAKTEKGGGNVSPLIRNGHESIVHSTEVTGGKTGKTKGKFGFRHKRRRSDEGSILEKMAAEPHHVTAEARGASVVFKHKDHPNKSIVWRVKQESTSDPLSSVKGSVTMHGSESE